MQFHFFKGAGSRKRHQRYGSGGMPAEEAQIAREIGRFLSSARRAEMLAGTAYYRGEQAILNRTRTAIGQGGQVTEVHNLPCAQVVDNQYRRLVDQKVDYLLGRRLTWRCEDSSFCRVLDRVMDSAVLRELKNLLRISLNEGIGWLYLYYNQAGSLSFRTLAGHEIIPVWRDEAHRELSYAIRLFEREEPTEHRGPEYARVRLAEVYDERGIYRFRLNERGGLMRERPFFQPYFDRGTLSFGCVPLIAFRPSSLEQPLLNRVRSLQDGLNEILSNFKDAMAEDVRNTLLVLVNYDGEDLGEFRRNLATYGAVKVKSVDGVAGDLKTLEVKVNHENYESVIACFRRAIVENGMGFDYKDTRLGQNANELSIRSVYADLDLDANEIECEWHASLGQLVQLLRRHCTLAQRPVGNASVEFIFNRDMLMNESEVINACVTSLGVISRESVVANHPWVNDVALELKRIDKERTLAEKTEQPTNNTTKGGDDDV